MRISRPTGKPLILLLLAMVVIIAAIGCTTSEPDAQKSERESRQTSYDALVANQPAETMDYSSTRETINFWINTWGVPGKLSFVYLLAANGQKIGYYVFEGLPVSYCALLTPNYEFVKEHSTWWKVQPPSIDGAYYSGGQCIQYYGKDAATGQYLEFTAGGSMNFLVNESPLPVNVEPLGFTMIEDVLDRVDPEIAERYREAQGADQEGSEDQRN